MFENTVYSQVIIIDLTINSEYYVLYCTSTKLRYEKTQPFNLSLFK